jgi:hypothetical protein
MKVKLTVRHEPGGSPGSWEDSKLTLKIIANRNLVNRIEEAIRMALAADCAMGG